MSDQHPSTERTPDDDWGALLAGRPAPGADARTAHEAALLRRAVGAAIAHAGHPASAAEQQTLDAVRARLATRLQTEASTGTAGNTALTATRPTTPAANDAWYRPRRLALAASLVLAVGVGTLAVRTALPPEDIGARAPMDQGVAQIYSRDPAALAETIRARLVPLGATVTVEARPDGARTVQGTLPGGARQEGDSYLQELGIAVDSSGVFRTAILPSTRQRGAGPTPDAPRAQ